MSEPNLDERIRAVARPELAAERDALAARVEELEARIARALDELGAWTHDMPYVLEARRILHGEDDTP